MANPSDDEEPAVEILFPPEAAGSRLDKALADRLPDHSRTSVAAWIKAGRVLLDGRREPARYRLEGGETAVARIPPPKPATVGPEPIPLSIIYEDDDLLVVDKPWGLSVHPGSGRPAGTLANALVHYAGTLPEGTGSDRPGIVHRLDKDTSGAIVVARTEPAQWKLSAAFAERLVHKTYLAIVHGAPDDDEGLIELAIGRHPKERKKMAVDGVAKRSAKTHWIVEQRLPRHTVMLLKPHTGRTHQIRVHMKAIRLPIVADPIYGNRGLVGDDVPGRLMLHAWKLAFPHPQTGEAMSFEAPIPADMTRAIEKLSLLNPPRRPR